MTEEERQKKIKARDVIVRIQARIKEKMTREELEDLLDYLKKTKEKEKEDSK